MSDSDARLHDACTRAQANLESCLKDEIEAGLTDRLRGCFAEFSELLRSRLETENKGSLYGGDLSVKKPRLADRIDQLRSGRRKIVDGLADVWTQISDLPDGNPQRVEAVRARARSFLDHLRDHERREIELLQTAFWREVGGGD